MLNHFEISFFDDFNATSLTSNSSGLKTPYSVIIPVIKFAGVTSNEGFQTCTSKIDQFVIDAIFHFSIHSLSTDMLTPLKVIIS